MVEAVADRSPSDENLPHLGAGFSCHRSHNWPLIVDVGHELFFGHGHHRARNPFATIPPEFQRRPDITLGILTDRANKTGPKNPFHFGSFAPEFINYETLRDLLMRADIAKTYHLIQLMLAANGGSVSAQGQDKRLVLHGYRRRDTTADLTIWVYRGDNHQATIRPAYHHDEVKGYLSAVRTGNLGKLAVLNPPIGEIEHHPGHYIVRDMV